MNGNEGLRAKGVDGVFSNKLIGFLHPRVYKSTGFLISESLFAHIV